MRQPCLLLLAAGWLVMAGCRVDPNHHLQVRELRRQEDQIFYLLGVIRDHEDQLNSCRRENDSLRRELERARQGELPFEGPLLPGPDRVPSTPSTPSTPPDPNGLRPPRIELGPPTYAPPRFRAPTISPDEPIAPGEPSRLPAPDEPFDLDNPDLDPAPRFAPPTQPAEELDPFSGQPASSSTVARIAINPLLSGGADLDGAPGHDGILAVIEPRDRDGRLVGAPGEVRLTVIDPADPTRPVRVAQWEFTAEETARRFRATGIGAGMAFELPWPNRPPRNSRLKLLVRYTTEDGRALAAQHEFTVRAAQGADGWSASAAESRPEPIAPPEPMPAERAAVRPARSPAAESSDGANNPRRPEWKPWRD